MTHPSSTASTCAAQWKMWTIKVFSVIYFTAACAAQDAQDETPTIYKPTLQLQSGWLDVFPTEKVEFNCSVNSSSDWTFTWHRNGEQVQDSDPRVSLSADGLVLTITAAPQIYSGNYFCKGHHKTKGITTADSDSLTVTVYENSPKPTVSRRPNWDPMFPGESVTFSCKVDVSTGWEYLWYHNGNEIPASTPNTHTIASIAHPNSGQYHCRAKRGKVPFYTEESERTTLQVSDPPQPSLKLQSHWLEVFEEEVVAFSCEVDNSDWTFTWYRDQQELQEDSVLILDSEGSLLNITSVAKTDRGVYACKAHLESRKVSSGFSNTATVIVHDTPKPTLHKVPGFNPMYVGETVKFTCNVNVSSGWEYQWVKDGHDLAVTSETNSIHLGLSDAGKYSCKATRSETTSTDVSQEIPQHVLEIPVPSLTLVTSWLDVFPTESVKLSCGMGAGSDWTYTWYRDGREVQADNVVSFDSNRATLSILSASASHAGQYTCKGHLNDRSVSSNSSSGLTLTVHGRRPSVMLTQDPDYDVMFSGESVSFSCHISVSSGWEYLWFKDNNPLAVSGNKHTISSVSTSNRGSYTCRAKRGTDEVFQTDSSQIIRLQVEENKPKPLMTRQPDVDKLYTGESVSFQCKVGLSSGWGYRWYKDGAELPIKNSSFNIHDANLLSNGTYECMAIRDKTMYQTAHSDGRSLFISEIPVPSSTLKTPWLDVFPTESVKLSCGMDGTSDWTYTWYKDGQQVQADDAASFDSDGTTLSINSASVSHRGQYSCSGKLKSRQVSSSPSSGLTLDVYDEIPRVELVQNPKHNVMHTGDPVSFSCHINVSSGWEYLWYKDDRQLAESGINHTITSVVTTNTGSYKCQAKRGKDTVFYSDQSRAVRLDVVERPQANIILQTGWSQVFSTDSLVLECGVQESQDMWNYTWFKEGLPIDLPPSERHSHRHIVTPQNDPEQSSYVCQGIRTGRPSYSKSSDSFTTKNLLLKRRVLLSISGFIFFAIIAVFFGCIVLRVIRKPDDDDDKPEETELFLTMAQQKGTDAACPLVQYITDATLNAPSKEEDENGTICSEATPLPITTQEEQAVTTESPETTENNGGLVSFKQ